MDVIRVFVMNGVTKPLRAYVKPSRVCLYGLFFLMGLMLFVSIKFRVGACFLSILKHERLDIGRGRHSDYEWGF